jgi:large subunit ribosomal protein L5
MSFREFYQKEVTKKVQESLKTENVMAVPRLKKIVLNVGAGEAVTNKNVIDKIVDQMSWISGQKPVITKARVSVSAFKIRKGLPIGVKVTMRGNNMYIFLEKLIKIVIPRIRDFRGIPVTGVDAHGNLNLGFTEQTIFPEVEFDRVDKLRGLQVTVVTSAKNYEEGRVLFESLGIPFTK